MDWNGMDMYGGYMTPEEQFRMMYGRAPHRPTQSEILQYIQVAYSATDVVKVNEFETTYGRHICPGGNVIQMLQASVCSVPSEVGVINVGVMFCPNCGKLIVNRETLTYM